MLLGNVVLDEECKNSTLRKVGVNVSLPWYCYISVLIVWILRLYLFTLLPEERKFIWISNFPNDKYAYFITPPFRIINWVVTLGSEDRLQTLLYG